jgi:hypothetical protein
VPTTILTRHPDKTKSGVRIDRAKYDTMRAAILTVLRRRGEATFTELSGAVERSLRGRFDGSIKWYVTTVKLDLEARRIIRRVPGSRPQQLRLV